MNLNTFLEIMNIPVGLSVDEILNMFIIYLRKSRKDMDYYKDETIEKTLQRHEKELQDFVVGIFGKPIPEHNIYREVASGDTIEDRPVMQEVLSVIEDENKKGVICIEIERLARGNTMDQGIIAQTFQYTQTKIITPFKIYNLDNEDDLSYFEDGLFQARKYLKYTKKILNRGRVRSVKDGKYIGSVLPYGFNKIKIPNEKGFMLIENESESKVVRLMADLFLNGLETTYTLGKDETISSVAKSFGVHKSVIATHNLNLKIGYELKVTVKGEPNYYIIKENDTLESISSSYNVPISNISIPTNFFNENDTLKIVISDMRPTNIAHYLNFLKITPRRAKQWTANMIRNILNGYAIYGYLTWDRRKTSKTLINGQVVKKNPTNHDFLLVKGKHQPILDDDVRNMIQEKFKSNSVKTIPDNYELKNPLVGLVVCGYCGNNMTRRPYYEKKDSIPIKRRVYKVDCSKLRLLLRESKGNYSLTQIAYQLNVSRDIVAHWFAPNDQRFSIPHADKWFKLKEVLNITTTEFDEAITTFKEEITPTHVDTLMCSRPRCKCVASDLELVENKLLNSLKYIKEQYKTYIDNYEEEVKKEISNNKELVEIIEREIDKTKTQIDKVCELVETGAYTQDLFIKRTNTLNEQLNSLLKQKTELSKTKDLTKEFNIKKNTIPILEDILSNYSSDLTAEERNNLLKTVIKEVIYTKDKGGRYLKDNFSVSIILNNLL